MTRLTMLLSLSAAVTYSQQQQPLYSCMRLLESGGVACSKYQEPEEEGEHWTNVIGIGPAKSGSTSLAVLFEETNVISVGNKRKWQGDLTESAFGSELNWFKYDDKIQRGLVNLAKAYSESESGLYFEKDPMYQENCALIAAYRARSFLGPKLKLIHTSRNFIDLDGSHYLYMNLFRKGYNYSAWIDARVQALDDFLRCRKGTFDNLIVPTYDGSKVDISKLHDAAYFSWEAAMQVDSVIYEKCGSGAPEKPHSAIIRIPMSAIFMVPQLKRWMHAFPNRTNLFCLDVDARIKDPATTYVNLYKFLGFKNQDFLDERRDIQLERQHSEAKKHHVEESMFDRIVASQSEFSDNIEVLKQSVSEAQARIVDAAKRFVSCEDVRWYQDTCGYVTPGFEDVCAL